MIWEVHKMSQLAKRREVAPAAPRRYTVTAQALHWVVAALMFLVVPIAWVMMNMEHAAKLRDTLYMLHKSIGLTILLLVAVRLAWRAAHPAPPLPGNFGRVQSGLAFASHWLLYLVLLGMPISGYLLSNAGGYPVALFGTFEVPNVVPHSRSLAEAADWVHVAIGQWLVYALVLLHIAATVFHAAVRRDGVLARMLPPQQID
jgi:cytochrome b561